ncbi:MAG: efflux RND transporter permease subunit [Alphaproteobacteria bacterium]|nr:efflux RND transporter permease subunit [Alphaproteobacteria bacterium]
MFAKLIDYSLRNRLFVMVAAVLLVAYGFFAMGSLNVDIFPDLNKPTVTLMTEADGLAPEEVERIISFPIETAMNGMPGVTRVRSVSAVGLSIVYVEFAWNTSIYINRQQVSERLALLREQLPARATPQMGPISSIMGEIMLIAVTSAKVDPMTLRELADWVIRPRLLSIPGVAQVIPIGGEVRQFRVTPIPGLMALRDVSNDQIESTITNFSKNSGGGIVDQYGHEFVIRNIGRTPQLETLRDLVVTWRGDQAVMLSQVAKVEFAARQKRGDAGYQGRPSVIMAVHKQPSTDTIHLTENLVTALGELQGVMPEDVKVDNILFRQSDFIETSIENVLRVLIEAVVVVAIVLFLFMANGRTTLISLTAIPVSVMITMVVFQQFGMSINTMTLGGLAIAIGELVDDAVVDVENIQRRLRQNWALAEPRPVLRVIGDASQEIRSGIVSATFIIILVFVPLFTLAGVEGRLFTPLGVAYIVSILASLVTSVTVTPVLCSFLLTRDSLAHRGDTWLVRWLKDKNRRLLLWAFDNMRRVAWGIGGAVALAVVLMFMLPRAFLPAFNEGSLTIGMYFDPGISLVESNRLGLIAEKLILEVPEVSGVGRRTGRAELDEHAEGVHAAEIDVDLRRSKRSREEVMEDMRARLALLPASSNIGQPISHRIDHLLSGVRAQLAIKIFGDDLDTLVATADRLRRRIAGTPGIVDLQVEKQTRVPQVRVQIDPERAMLFGTTPAAVAQELEAMSSGRVVSQILDQNRRFDVVLKLGDDDRRSEGLTQLLIDTPSGRVPVREVARVEDTDGSNQILRENGRRRIVVLANTDGGDIQRIVDAIRAEIRRLDVPPGYFTTIEGKFQAQEEASLRIAGLSVISMVLIFVVLFNRYRSAVLSLIIMGNVPLSLIGGVVAVILAGHQLSIASMIGFVTLAGIATRNGILKISHYLHLATHEREPFGREMILRGSLERLTPVLMTAAAAGFALLPLMTGASEPGKEILAPVAVVIFGGLISATVLDAIGTPLLFLRYGGPAVARLVEAARRDKAADPMLPSGAPAPAAE